MYKELLRQNRPVGDSEYTDETLVEKVSELPNHEKILQFYRNKCAEDPNLYFKLEPLRSPSEDAETFSQLKFDRESFNLFEYPRAFDALESFIFKFPSLT